MIVGIALFEFHIPHAQSLKEKRSVVRSLRDRLRGRYEISVAEVGLQDLHQRTRLGVAVVAAEGSEIERMFDQIAHAAEKESDALLVGWNLEVTHFEEEVPLDGMKFE
ncbi:MAG TPA: DUF503 domain-containing protein [Thermoanaerobaculia bacterium]|nr:DUF503 domain-containing protein [Thermoanaerobaculia bacterium]